MTSREFFLTLCLAVPYSVSGCGQLPQRQGKTLNYEVTGFKLPAAMVYIEDNKALSQVPSISTSEQQTVTFVQNFVVSSVEDVLYQQGRAAGLSDDLISIILSQFDITVNYKPLKCDIIFLTADGTDVVMNNKMNCQIMSDTVTKICTMTMMNAQNMQMCPADKLMDIDPMYLTISGSLTTSNIIMANWSTQMWQIVFNRALRSLTSGPLRSKFVGASVTFK